MPNTQCFFYRTQIEIIIKTENKLIFFERTFFYELSQEESNRIMFTTGMQIFKTSMQYWEYGKVKWQLHLSVVHNYFIWLLGKKCIE